MRTPPPSLTHLLLAITALALVLSVGLWRSPGEASPPHAASPSGPFDVHEALFGGVDPTPRPRPAVAGEVDILVDLDDDSDESLERALERRHDLELTLNSAHSGAARLLRARVPEGDVERLLEALREEDGVEAAEVDGVVELFSTAPDDPLYMFQWNFTQVRAEGGWSYSAGGGAVVAVIDTGVAYENSSGDKPGILVPDLAQTRFVEGYDFVEGDHTPYDDHGHGTHVAGTVAQSTNNNYGVAGLAFESAIMPLRVLDGQGRGGFGNVADAIRYAADHDADVINLSLGSFIPSRAVELAIEYAHEQGVVVVAAAGNSGTKVRCYPAAFEHVIAVAATQYDRTPTFYSNHGRYVDIAAPGGNVLEDQNDDGRPDGILQETLGRDEDGAVVFEPKFALYMGTSMASPHVAAAAAMLVGAGVSNPDEVERLLRANASDEDGQWKRRYGDGILDVEAALRAHALATGLWHTGGGLVLALLAFWGLRRSDSLALGDAPARSGAFWGGWALGCGALFALPWCLPATPAVAPLLWLSQPLTSLDVWLLSPGARSPLFVSALLPFAALALLLGHDSGRRFAAGLTLGTAATLLTDAWCHAYDVAWIPGIGALDRLWLVGHGLLCFALGVVALRRR